MNVVAWLCVLGFSLNMPSLAIAGDLALLKSLQSSEDDIHFGTLEQRKGVTLATNVFGAIARTKALGITVVPLSKRFAANGISSQLILGHQALRGHFVYALLSRAIEQRFQTEMPTPQDCGNDGSCCLQSPTVDCLAIYEPEQGGMFQEMAKVQHVAAVMNVLAAEIARDTRIVRFEEIKNQILTGNDVWYVWDYDPPSQPASFMLTSVTPELTERIVVALNLVRESLAASLYGIELSNAYLCGSAGIQPAQRGDTTAVRISTGKASNLRRAVKQHASSLAVSFEGNKLVMWLLHQDTEWNKDWFGFLKGKGAGALLACMGQEGNRLVQSQMTVLNARDVAVVLMYGLYGLGLAGDFADVTGY